MTNNNSLFGTDNSDLILGTNSKDHIEAWAGDDTIVASQGDDIIFGGIGKDTYYYSNLPGNQVTIASLGLVFENITVTNEPGFSTIRRVNISVNKNQLGHDVIIDTTEAINLDLPTQPIVGKLVAPDDRNNTFQADASSYGGFIDLSQELYVFNGAARVDGSLEFTIENFVNAIGSDNRDRLIDSNKNNRLKGQGGDDFLAGNAGNDTFLLMIELSYQYEILI